MQNFIEQIKSSRLGQWTLNVYAQIHTLWTWDSARTILLWIILPALAGSLIAASIIEQPVVGMIYLNSAIDSYSSRDLINQINYARAASEIRAVVLVLNSPGGTVTDTESIYQELLKLRKDKPVVTYVSGMAASGAYYLSVGTDYIVANPSADVGNIGVIGYLPQNPTIFEGILSTGPYKLWGMPRDTYARQIEMIKQGFFEAVTLGRGSKLKGDPAIIFRGEIWPGIEAQRLGLIDQLGSESDAIRHAERIARISNSRTLDLSQKITSAVQPFSFFAKSADGTDLPYPAKAGIYLLFIPPSADQ